MSRTSKRHDAGHLAGHNAGLLGQASSNRPPSVAIGPTAEVLRRLELTVRRRLDGLLQGDYQGLVPGHGTELGETRQYVAGDDVRRIDWNVSARMTDTYVRETIADRELETWVIADLSASLGFGTADCEKRDLAIAAIAAVGFLTQRTGNRIGAAFLGADGGQTVPARGGRTHLQALLHNAVLAAKDPSRGSVDLGAGIRRMGAIMRRRGLAVVVSDFLCDANWEQPLRGLSARHETLCIEVVDPAELTLADVGIVHLEDPETGDILEVPTNRAGIREQYAAAAAEQRATIAASIRAAGADHLVLRTDRDWLLDLVHFVSSRRDRVDALARTRA